MIELEYGYFATDDGMVCGIIGQANVPVSPAAACNLINAYWAEIERLTNKAESLQEVLAKKMGPLYSDEEVTKELDRCFKLFMKKDAEIERLNRKLDHWAERLEKYKCVVCDKVFRSITQSCPDCSRHCELEIGIEQQKEIERLRSENYMLREGGDIDEEEEARMSEQKLPKPESNDVQKRPS